MPPIFDGSIVDIVGERSGQIILLGVAVCLAGIAVTGMAGMSKESELSEEEKKAAVKEFSFVKGILVATFSGIMSSAFAYGLAAGKPIGELANTALLEHGRSDLWQNLPVLIVVLWGGFTTNCIWCVILNIKNGSGREYLALQCEVPANAEDGEEQAGLAAENEVRTESVSDDAELCAVGAGWDGVVPAVLLLQHGADADGKVRVFELDASHGEHHHLQQPVGNRLAGMEGYERPHEDLSCCRIDPADRVNGGCWVG